MQIVPYVSIVLLAVALTSAAPPAGEGKYTRSNENSIYNNGKYNPNDRNSGRYVHDIMPYRHVADMRELGIYHHIHNPYGGGYGPYFGLQNPYVHDGRGIYVPPPTTTTTPRPTTTTPRTTTTTTQRPRLFDYYDEGGWKIIRQEEQKKKDKYDFLFLTENGIYGQENAHIKDMGTMSMGFYEYTGDDGKLYRVNYNSGKGGFMPMGDHIPTIPPQIKRALEYTARKQAERAARAAGQVSPPPVAYEEEAVQQEVVEEAGQESIQRPARYESRRHYG
ncbi:hypothetical protein ACFFRR_008344 [Megaselia abdita]